MPQLQFRRTAVLGTLTRLQYVSAGAFGAFLVVHLAAPTVAAVLPHVGCDVASKTMILGRVAYQNAVSEPIFVWGALGVHTFSSVAKRALLLFWPVPRYGVPPDSVAQAEPSVQLKERRCQLNWHAVTGYVLVPVVTLHAFLNRIRPSSPAPPVFSLSPSELGMEFVAHGFHSTPIISTFVYGALIVASAWHVAGGIERINARASSLGLSLTRRQGKKYNLPTIQQGDVVPTVPVFPQTARKSRHASTAIAAGAAQVILLTGLWRIIATADGVGPSQGRRLDAVYKSVWPFSLRI